MKTSIKQTEATKKSSADFGSASSAAARIRRAFDPLFSNYKDETLINRLNKQLLFVFKTIPQVFVGSKKLIQGNVKLLNGFQFYSEKRLDLLLLRPPNMALLDTGQLEIEFTVDKHRSLLKEVPNAIAAVLQLMVYNMDLNGNADEIISGNPLPVALDGSFKGAKLKIPLMLAGERLVLMAMSIHYVDSKGIIGSRRTKAGAIIFAMKLKDGVEIPFLQEEEEIVLVAEKAEGLDWITY